MDSTPNKSSILMFFLLIPLASIHHTVTPVSGFLEYIYIYIHIYMNLL